MREIRRGPDNSQGVVIELSKHLNRRLNGTLLEEIIAFVCPLTLIQGKDQTTEFQPQEGLKTFWIGKLGRNSQ
jgi:hypothetical protein